MIKKRLLCILLAVCLLIPMSLPTYAASESNELKNVTLSLYSNLSPERYISGLYRDNTFYITLEDLCVLTRGKIVKETEEEAVVSFGNCRNGRSIREFVIDVGSGNMAETLHSDKYNITMPSLTQDGKVYVSALHFLRYLGATVKLQEDAPIQFMVIKRYDIFDALSDLINSDLGNFFWWDEVDTGEENLEDKLTNAGVIALINRDSNIFRMMFDAKGIEQEALEDALLSIVKNEGQGYFTENSIESELIDTASGIIGAESDWFDLIKEAYSDGSDVLGEQISKLAERIAITAGVANNLVGAIESLKQFDNMSTSQKNLFEKTILEYPEDSKTLCDGWDVVFDAAQNVSKKIQNEYDAQYKAALDVAESTAYDFLNGVTGAAGANPVSIAWSGVTLLTKMIPFTNEMVEKKVQLYNGYNCSIIQLIANEMLVEAYSDWYYGNALYTGPSEQYKKLDTVKQLIILQLKSTLTTREYLINSGFLENSYASEMKQMNQETAALLNKVENCQINGVDLFSAEYENDISWIENYKTGYIYQAYYNKLMKLQGQYGAVSIIAGEYESWLLGLCFAKLIDFNSDGIEELILAYCSGLEYTWPQYVLEVWEYNNGEIRQAFKGDCLFNQEIYAAIKLCYYDNQYFFAQSILNVDEYALWWGEDSSLQGVEGTALFGYSESKILPVHSLLVKYTDAGDTYQIDGVDMTWEDFANDNLWSDYSKNLEDFWLTDDEKAAELNKTLAELENTFATLQGYLGITTKITQTESGWKQAYIDYVQEAGWGDTYFNYEFYLLDVNGDDIPELLVDFQTTAEGATISTYDGSQINTMYMWTYGFSYIPGENLFCDSGGHMDVYYDYIYKIENGQFIRCGYGDFGAENNSKVQFDEDGYPIYRYYWNNQEVNESAYNEMLNDLYDASRVISPYDGDAMNYMEVLAAIMLY